MSHHKPWTSTELATLHQHAHQGATTCALLLGRTTKAVRRQAERQRISLRTPNNRQGILLGQPTHTTTSALATDAPNPTLIHHINQQIRDGQLPATIQTEAHKIATGHYPICPACARNYANHPTTGTCRSCYLRALAEAHHQHHDEQAAQQELWTARQQAKRRRDRHA